MNRLPGTIHMYYVLLMYTRGMTSDLLIEYSGWHTKRPPVDTIHLIMYVLLFRAPAITNYLFILGHVSKRVISVCGWMTAWRKSDPIVTHTQLLQQLYGFSCNSLGDCLAYPSIFLGIESTIYHLY